MIEVEGLTKKFGDFTALNHINCSIPEGCVYGLVGINGAGKSTFLRLLTGIYRPDSGKISIDGQKVFNNPATKENFVFVPDELFFLPQSNLLKMASFYKSIYDTFSMDRFHSLSESFHLDVKKNIHTFSKGMKRQAETVLAISCMPKYLFFDETFDGLDPVVRNVVKKVIRQDVKERKMTAVITSHSLKELGDTCDQMALLNKGGMLLESDIRNSNTSLFKVQIAFDCPYTQSMFDGIDLCGYSKTGSVATFIVKGDKYKTLAMLKEKNPVMLEVLPMTLEDIFVYDADALGYSTKDILM